MYKAVILTGIKHCGKSTQGKLLAEKFKCSFYDTDNIITNITGQSPRQIYTNLGVEAFIKAEIDACVFLENKIAQESFAVVATGGGICNNNEALKILSKMGPILFMESSEKVAINRIIKEIVYVDGKMTELPAYIAKYNPITEDDVKKIFSEFYKERCKKYRELAQIVCKMENAPIPENNEILIKALKEYGFNF